MTADLAALDAARVPETLPGMLLLSTVVFPYDVVSVQVNRPKALRMLADHPGENVLVACVFPKDPEAEDAETAEDLLPVAVACRVIHRMKMPNETLQVVFQGVKRVEVREVVASEPYLSVQVEEVDPKEARGTEVDGLVYRCMELVGEIVKTEPGYPQEMVEILRMNIAGGGRFADLVGAHVNLALPTKRKVAATADVRDRLRLL